MIDSKHLKAPNPEPRTTNLDWRKGDPRDANPMAASRTHIAILVDQRIFGGMLEVDHSWSIFLHPNHLERQFIGPDDPWPMGWRWYPVPRVERSQRD